MKAFRVAMTLVWILLVPCSLSVADHIEVQRAHFAAGASSATLKGSLAGDKTIDYRLGAKAGQIMTVALKSNEVGTSGGSGPTAPGEGTEVASVAEMLPEIWTFLADLSPDVKSGTIRSTEQFMERCRAFYSDERMAQTEAVVPGWTHMASYENGKTLWHINMAMVALLQLEEYQAMSPRQKKVQEWIVLLHDLAKEPANGRDHRHGFRSAALAGRIMPKLRFPVTSAYPSAFQKWFDLTDTATRFDAAQGLEIQDNAKLPEILSLAKRIFAEPTRTAISVIALHQSITSLAAWPVKAPLMADQVRSFVDRNNFMPLLTMMLADSGGWNLFDPPTLDSMYTETGLSQRFAELADDRRPPEWIEPDHVSFYRKSDERGPIVTKRDVGRDDEHSALAVFDRQAP